MRERLLGIVAMAAILVGVAVFLSLWLTNGGGHTITEWALGEAPSDM